MNIRLCVKVMTAEPQPSQHDKGEQLGCGRQLLQKLSNPHISSLFPLSSFLIIPLQIYYLQPNGHSLCTENAGKQFNRAKTCLVRRLAANHEVHGSEEVLLRAGNEAVGALGEGKIGRAHV